MGDDFGFLHSTTTPPRLPVSDPSACPLNVVADTIMRTIEFGGDKSLVR